MKRKKILLYGIGSLQNKGCEALVNSTINQIENNARIVAASFDYKNDKNMYKEKIEKFVDHHKHDEQKFDKKELEEFNRLQTKKWNTYDYECFYERDVINEMKDADMCIHIGGDNYCYGVNEWMYAITKKARELGKKNILWGASLYDEIKDVDLIEDLKRYDLLILREKISYNAIKKYISEDKLMLIPDPAFSLKPKSIQLNKWYEKGNIIGLNLSPLTIKNDEQYESIKSLIDYILNKTKYKILLLSHVTVEEASDLIILRRIANDYKDNNRIYLEEKDYNCQELKYIISKCHIIVASRTHASIAAYSSCIPTLVIGYSVKSRGIAEDIFGNYEKYVLPANEISKQSIISSFEYILDNKQKIKKYLSDKMPSIIEQSSKIYENMMKKLKYQENKKICSHECCTGCCACYNICPVNAIEIKENKEGFNYPIINDEKCINCGLCKKTCPILNKRKVATSKIDCYVAKSKNSDLLMKSSSGGIFTHLALEILNNSGVVYGATMIDFKVKHIRIAKKEDLSKIRGSKYSESWLGKIYQKVKKDLDNDIDVLFSGTPCQILGLKKYLQKKYKNLTTISVICHGVINYTLLKKRISEFENIFETKVTNVVYKSKKNGWDKSSIEYSSEQISKTYKFMDDPLMNLYINNHILRESCYNCPAKGLDNNYADIILGDYWGVYYEHNDFFDKLGTSAIIIKTPNGKTLFDKIKNSIKYEYTTYEQIVKYNPALDESMPRPKDRSIIFEKLSNNTLQMIKEKYEYEEKIKNLQQEIDEKMYIVDEYNNVINSKKYKLINKFSKLYNKIKGVK